MATLLEVVASPNALTNKFNNLVSCCPCLLASNLDFVGSFIRRQVDKIIHGIARASLCYINLHIFYDVPPIMCYLITNEMF